MHIFLDPIALVAEILTCSAVLNKPELHISFALCCEAAVLIVLHPMLCSCTTTSRGVTKYGVNDRSSHVNIRNTNG